MRCFTFSSNVIIGSPLTLSKALGFFFFFKIFFPLAVPNQERKKQTNKKRNNEAVRSNTRTEIYVGARVTSVMKSVRKSTSSVSIV